MMDRRNFLKALGVAPVAIASACALQPVAAQVPLVEDIVRDVAHKAGLRDEDLDLSRLSRWSVPFTDAKIVEIRSRISREKRLHQLGFNVSTHYYSYLGDMQLSIPPGTKIKRLWADGFVIYDKGTDQCHPSLCRFTWHIYRMDLTRFGNRFPQITAEFA